MRSIRNCADGASALGLALWVGVISSQPAAASAAAPDRSSGPAQRKPVTVRDIRRTVLPDTVRVTIELDDEVDYRDERLTGPARMFVDLRGTRAHPSLVNAVLLYDDDVVRQIRVGHHPNQTTRVVLDLQGVTRYSLFALYSPYRLVIECERRPTQTSPGGPGGPPATSANSVAPKSDRPGRSDGPESPERPARPLPSVKIRQPLAIPQPPASEPVAAAAAERAEPAVDDRPRPIPSTTQAPAALPIPAAPAANLQGRLSIARQLGLGVARIVIDPGHGGHDPGALASGLSEADLVLDVALRLERLLLKQPGIEVVLTRREHLYVPLEERTAIANREAADLFLSIHANASRNRSARGVETYFLNFASTPEAEAVAARENAASDRRMHSLSDIVRAIALNNKLDESRDFAAFVQQSMVGRLRASNKTLRDLGVRQAPFVVLIGATMPSVLAEISFVTNRYEAQLLKGRPYRQRIAEALLEGILRYQRALKKIGAIAQRHN